MQLFYGFFDFLYPDIHYVMKSEMLVIIRSHEY